MMRTLTHGPTAGRALILACFLVGAVLSARAEPAGAAFPGSNGKIAFSSNRVTLLNLQGDFEIFTMNANGDNKTRLTDNGVLDFDPAWSPNAKRLAITRRLGTGNDEIFTIKATGGDPIRLTNSSASDGSPDWQPQ